MSVNSIIDLYKYSEDPTATGYKRIIGLYMRDIFSWLFALGWEPGDVMINAFEKVILITKSSG